MLLLLLACSTPPEPAPPPATPAAATAPEQAREPELEQVTLDLEPFERGRRTWSRAGSEDEPEDDCTYGIMSYAIDGPHVEFTICPNGDLEPRLPPDPWGMGPDQEEDLECDCDEIYVGGTVYYEGDQYFDLPAVEVSGDALGTPVTLSADLPAGVTPLRFVWETWMAKSEGCGSYPRHGCEAYGYRLHTKVQSGDSVDLETLEIVLMDAGGGVGEMVKVKEAVCGTCFDGGTTQTKRDFVEVFHRLNRDRPDAEQLAAKIRSAGPLSARIVVSHWAESPGRFAVAVGGATVP